MLIKWIFLNSIKIRILYVELKISTIFQAALASLTSPLLRFDCEMPLSQHFILMPVAIGIKIKCSPKNGSDNLHPC